MAMKIITVSVDEDVMRQAEVILDDIGLTVTFLLSSCLEALVRERKVPFALVNTEYETQKMIRHRLEESQLDAADPASKRFTHEDVFTPLREKYGYVVQD